MSRRVWWTGGFLTVTGLAVGAELLAALDDSPDTVPWTELLTDLPWWVTMPAALTLSVWLPLHLASWYRRRRADSIVPRRYDNMAQGRITPPSTRADARNRAWRTLAQGLLVDVLAGVTLAVGPALADEHFAFTAPYWAFVGALAAKTAVQTVVAWAARHLVPPQP